MRNYFAILEVSFGNKTDLGSRLSKDGCSVDLLWIIKTKLLNHITGSILRQRLDIL